MLVSIFHEFHLLQDVKKKQLHFRNHLYLGGTRVRYRGYQMFSRAGASWNLVKVGQPTRLDQDQVDGAPEPV